MFKYNRYLVLLVFLWLLLAISLAVFGPGSSTGSGRNIGSVGNVVLIGWDSADRDIVWECLGRGELPNTASLIAEGGIIAIDHRDNGSETVTKPGWAQVLTGYGCNTTGISSNDEFRQLSEGWTIYERLEEHFGSENFVTVAVVGKAQVGPQWVYKEAKERMDEFVYPSYHLDDDAVIKSTLEFLEQYSAKPFFFFVHLGELDTTGHLHGVNSIQYHDALVYCDVLLGDIVAKLKELGLYDDTLIYVTADHGHGGDQNYNTKKKRYNHHDCPDVFLATNDPAITKRGSYPSKTPAGTLLDIAPTILTRFGLDLDKIDPPLYGSPLLD